MPHRHQIYLDTNAAIVLIEGEGLLRDLMRDLASKASCQPGASLCTSALTISELLVKPLRDGDRKLVEVYRAWGSGLPWLQIIPVGSSILDTAAQLRARRNSLKLPDAIHVASAFAVATTHFLTEDRGISPPFENPAAQAAPHFELCRLNEPTLTSLIESLSA